MITCVCSLTIDSRKPKTLDKAGISNTWLMTITKTGMVKHDHSFLRYNLGGISGYTNLFIPFVIQTCRNLYIDSWRHVVNQFRIAREGM